MHFRLPLLAVALTAAVALPSSAQAVDLPPVPCVDAAVASAGCTSSYGEVPAVAEVCPGRDDAPSAQNLAVVRDATLCLVNKQRTRRGLGRLKPVTPLQSVATAYARRMVRERFFDHTAPDGSTFFQRIKRTSYLDGGIRSWSVGENIAWGTGDSATADEIVQAWMASPGHRRNILNGKFTELGLGVALGVPQHGAGADDAATYVNEFGERRR